MKPPAEFGTNAVTWKYDDGTEFSAEVAHFSQHSLTLETANPDLVVQASEVLGDLEVLARDQRVYSGRAVVSKVLNARSRTIFDVTLDPPGLQLPWRTEGNVAAVCQAGYEDFYRRWSWEYKISPEFKALVTDIGSFLGGVQQWLDQVEAGLNGRLKADVAREQEMVLSLASRVIPAFNSQHERFEELSYAIPPELRGVHQDLVRRHWHTFFLNSPFGWRTYRKPLGYAGDYEMMDSIHRKAPEGRSLFARLIHFLLVSQWPAESVRNRITHMREVLAAEINRVATADRRARILNIGCGPAREVQYLVRDTALSNEADFTLLDFNDETICHTGGRLGELKRLHARNTGIEMVKMSVLQLLRGRSLNGPTGSPKQFDVVYCTGLFDYLSLSTCQALVKLFHEMLSPGGIVVIANMDDAKPFRNFIEFVLDWHLIYRDTGEVRAFCPDHLLGNAKVVAEPASVNLFLHLRKPD